MVQLTDLNDVNAARPRLVDSQTGIQVIKGGITRDTSFLDSCVSAYANLVNQPVTLLLGAFLTFMYLAEEAKTDGPLEAIKEIMEPISNSSDILWEKRFAHGAIKVLDFLIRWKFQFIAVGYAWLPYMAKPSRNSMGLSIVHTFLIFLMRKWSTLTFILVAHAHFLFVSLRKPIYKMIIILLVIAFLFLDVEFNARVKRNSDPSKSYLPKGMYNPSPQKPAAPQPLVGTPPVPSPVVPPNVQQQQVKGTPPAKI